MSITHTCYGRCDLCCKQAARRARYVVPHIERMLIGVSMHAAGNSSLLEDFDWEAYLHYYPALRRQGVTTAKAAALHYLHQGRAEVRPVVCAA